MRFCDNFSANSLSIILGYVRLIGCFEVYFTKPVLCLNIEHDEHDEHSYGRLNKKRLFTSSLIISHSNRFSYLLNVDNLEIKFEKWSRFMVKSKENRRSESSFLHQNEKQNGEEKDIDKKEHLRSPSSMAMWKHNIRHSTSLTIANNENYPSTNLLKSKQNITPTMYSVQKCDC